MRFCFITTLHLSRHASMKRSVGMAPELVSHGHSVTLVMHDHPENRLVAAKMPEVECVFVPVGGTLSERRWKSRFLAGRAFDVIVYNSLCWRNAVRKGGLSQPALALMEHCELESSNKSTGILRRSAQSVLEWWSLFAFEGHICASRYLLDLMKRRVFFFNLRRVIFWSPYAVDDDVATSGGQAAPTISAGGDKFIFHVGTVAKNYGCLFMVAGLQILRQQRQDWQARFIGKGRDLDEARRRVSELGLEACVIFDGYVPEEAMRDQLARANVFLSHLNDTEQDWARCPSKLYYYMAKGKPIVTASVGENRVALGESGFYYRADDPADFARALGEALDAGPEWAPLYSPESVTWSWRTEEFLGELRGLRRENA
jgi:glycosyltransferase involved in cell wall biosynthesis